MNSGIAFDIPGRPVAKSNNYQIIRIKGFTKIVPTKDVKQYQQTVAESCPKFPTYEEKLCVLITWHRGDKRRKDLDNIAKAIKDGITDAQLWSDDSQVVQLFLQSVSDVKGAENEWVRVHILPMINELCISNAPCVPNVLDLDS